MPDVLIFDDDPGIGSLIGEVLRGRGLTSQYFPSGAGVVQIVHDARPRLVLLDIMMPGIDGLTACRAIRSAIGTRHVKIVVLTAKTFAVDRDTAKRCGADLFVNKPFNCVELADRIGRLMGIAAPAVESGPPPPAPPLLATVFAGGAVVELPGLWVFFDAGAGVAGWLSAHPSRPPACWVLLTRYDEPAISGLRSFAPLLESGCRINLAGPDDVDLFLQRLAPRMCGVPGFRTQRTPLLYPQREGETQLAAGVNIVTRYTQHPGSCLAYRLEAQGRRLVWCPANDVPARVESWNRHEREKFRSLFAEADLLLHGFARSLADPPPSEGEARGAWEPVAALARDAGVKRLALVPLFGARTENLPEVPLRVRLAEPYVL